MEKPAQKQQASNIEQFDDAAVNRRDLQQPLYAARKKVFPKKVKGNFRNLKWFVMVVTLSIYYITPWLRWDRGPFAPDQAVLIDLYHRRFYFFFIEIWPQEFYYVAGLLIMAAIGLFLVTSSVGRAWCGYACPQTVWVDLFLVIERTIEGDRNSRKKLDAAPMTAGKLAKRTLKHFLWLEVAIITGGAWVFYFVDAPTLFVQLFTGLAPSIAYSTIAVLAFTTYYLGGLMREQLCTYMCPWPRIQAAMLDEHSLTVTYNDWRGEPRSRHQKKAAAEGRSVGDCVDCNACVAVCPMGIDIRDGQQLECITCALCIDACDDVMKKLGHDKGLISYATLSDYNYNIAKSACLEETKNKPSKKIFRLTNLKSIIRPRIFVYGTLWGIIGIAMLVALLMRDRLELNILHDRNPLFVKLSDGSIRNGYTIKILNMMPEPREIRLAFKGLPNAEMFLSGTKNAPFQEKVFKVKPDQVHAVKVFVRTKIKTSDTKQLKFSFLINDNNGSETASYDAVFETGKR